MAMLKKCNDCRPKCFAMNKKGNCIALNNTDFYDRNGHRVLCPFYKPVTEAKADRVKYDDPEFYLAMIEDGMYIDEEVKKR